MGLGFGVWGLGFGFWGLGFWVWARIGSVAAWQSSLTSCRPAPGLKTSLVLGLRFGVWVKVGVRV